MGEIIAERTGRMLLVPPQWMALDPEPDPLLPCASCGHFTSEKTKEDGRVLGIDGPICIVCYMLITQLWSPK